LSTGFPNDKAAYDYFVAKGLTNFQAAGIVGNLDQESGVDPSAVQSGGPGRGIAQWSVGGRWDTTAGDNLLAYATSQGQPSGSLNLQLDFIWDELSSFSQYGMAQLRATTSVTDATTTFETLYEACGQCDASARLAYAQSVLNAYGSTPPPQWGATYVSQTWPPATTALTLKCGQRVSASLVLTNTGTQEWNSSTTLATTMARGRASIFAGSDWVAPDRPASIHGTVAPGANGTFSFSFNGPTGASCAPGQYKEYFGVVQEGVAWFSDAGQGGPPDDQIEALIELVADDGVLEGNDGGVLPQRPLVGSVVSAGCSVGASADVSLGGLLALLLLRARARARAPAHARRERPPTPGATGSPRRASSPSWDA
jgi:hypothetical protein